MKLPFILLVAILVVLAALGGYAVGNKGGLNLRNNSTVPGTSSQAGFFDSQNANVQGQVTKIDGNKVTIKNVKGETQVFTAADQVFITKFNGNTPASPSADLKTVELNKNVIISLMAKNGDYQIVSISQTPPAPTTTPPAPVQAPKTPVTAPAPATNAATPR